MPSFNQQTLNYNALNGNSVVVFVGDVPIAFAQSTNPAVDFGTEGLYGIGSAKPQEIQQLKFVPSINLESFALTSTGLETLGYPSTLLQILANNSFNINVLDASGDVLLSYIGCVANNFNETIPVNALITDTISFLAMDVLNPEGQSILNGSFALQSIGALATEGVALNAIGL